MALPFPFSFCLQEREKRERTVHKVTLSNSSKAGLDENARIFYELFVDAGFGSLLF